VGKDKKLQALVERHVKDDSKFAEALLREGIDAMLSGDPGSIRSGVPAYSEFSTIRGIARD
jgi:hypothetical protein